MQSQSGFWDRAARKYAAAPMKDIDSFEKTLARTRAHLRPDHRVLELGAGSGATAMRLAPDVAYILATDISAEMVSIAQEKAQGSGVANIAFRQASLGDSDFPEAPFDVVLALNLLHLLPDLHASLEAVHALLPPGGLFIAKTPCLKGSLIIPVAIKAMQLAGRAPHVSILGGGELDAAIQDAGFDILETLNAPAKPPARLVVARRL